MILTVAILLFQFPAPAVAPNTLLHSAPAANAQPLAQAAPQGLDAHPASTSALESASAKDKVAKAAAASGSPSQPVNTQAGAQSHGASGSAANVDSADAFGNASAPDDTSKAKLRVIAAPPDFAAASFSNIYLPAPPAFRPPDEAPITHRKSWLLLSAVEHSSAGFDAWSTRYALSNGRVEADPLMRPFASSAAIYGAIQAIPIGLDYVAHRFQRSSGWTHRIWWAPQAIASATFLFSGSYNIAHTN